MRVPRRLLGHALPFLMLWSVFAAEIPPLKHATVVIAHRGEHLRHHENTLESIDGAVLAGADFTEMDVRRSKDGQYLIMHDSTVDRMTDGHGRVADLTWEELSKRIVQDKHLTNVPPSRIPKFDSALTHCRNRIHVYLDFKSGDRREVAALVRAAGMEKQVLVYDSVDGIAEWRSVAPELPIITSPGASAGTESTALRAFIERYRPEVMDQAPSAAFVQTVTALGVRLWPDIQRREEGPDYWRSILAKGVRGFQTDHPAELVRWLEQEGLR